MSAASQDEILGRAYDRRLMRRLLAYVRPYTPLVAVAIVAAILHSVSQVAGPFFNQVAIDRYLDPSHPARGEALLFRLLPANAFAGLSVLALLYVGLLAVGFGLDYLQTYVMQWIGQHSMYDLRRAIFAHLQRLPIAFYDRNPVGRMVTRVTNDVETLNEMISSALVAFFDDSFVLVLIIVFMFGEDWRLALITLSVLPGIVLATQLFRHAVRTAYGKVRIAVARINVFFQEHVSGMAVVQAFRREQRALDEFQAINAAHRCAWMDAVRAHAFYYPVVEFFSTVAVAMILWFGGLRVLHHGLTVGLVVAFTQYAQRFFRPIQELSEKYNTLQTAMAGAERIFALLDEPDTAGQLGGAGFPSDTAQATERSAVAADGRGVAAAPPSGRIDFEHVWFAYQGDQWVLKDVSFTVEPGARIAVVGHTGAGKTTLISLLLRFYEIQRGRILLDGADIRHLDPRQLRRRFGVVLQDPFLFSGTLAANLRFGAPDDAPIERALGEVDLHDWVAELPQGLETVVRERGSGLSTGQKQLVGFARALAAQPQCLILDEATASVDTATELHIRRALDRLLQGRSSIIIAHRLSTIQSADRILVMHKGVLREQGAHQELLRQRGIYWRLYRLHYRDQERETAVDLLPS